MEKASNFCMGQVDPGKVKKLKITLEAVFGKVAIIESLTTGQTLEFLPLDLSGKSPLFITIGENLKRFGDKLPNYKKISESKNNARTCVILQDRESPRDFISEHNNPDFFLNIDTGELFISGLQKW